MERFDGNHDKIARNSHYIILLNGIILAAYSTIFSRMSIDAAPIVNLTPIYNSTFMSNHVDVKTILIHPYSAGVALILLHIFVLLPVFFSMLRCLGAVNSGLWDRVKKGPVAKSELIARERVALDSYTSAAKNAAFGAVGLIAVTFSIFVGPLIAFALFAISGAIVYTLMKALKVFDRFVTTDDNDPPRRS
ncbi:MAG: hypothetical protein ABFC38_09375 [Methanospirillum sp.]